MVVVVFLFLILRERSGCRIHIYSNVCTSASILVKTFMTHVYVQIFKLFAAPKALLRSPSVSGGASPGWVLTRLRGDGDALSACGTSKRGRSRGPCTRAGASGTSDSGAMPGQCYRGRPRHARPPAGTRTERGRHRQPSGEASKTRSPHRT